MHVFTRYLSPNTVFSVPNTFVFTRKLMFKNETWQDNYRQAVMYCFKHRYVNKPTSVSYLVTIKTVRDSNDSNFEFKYEIIIIVDSNGSYR